ncbi:uncharacterized protein BT62DRAFT_418388 [Guyanagaster necrorhizus]|uniref:Chitin-binding type-4 domain-containing protein n=1 Tax=Guyanagaster necrorhizus TaxID=856835 RepID=A0A9P7W3D2_9AGAR|nr:uncharacterized protein BT62DRAFT_418388 [Guyanagaster necrorhizus MCA 3950]KAG7451349.1 hypothetical protein BT62DRAFT_418388 [Guyanagaster necrorhizus MCA 3950]
MISATLISTSVVFLAGQAFGHGKLTSPPPRSDTIGSAFSEACGSQLLSVETSDPYGNIQQEMQTSSDETSACNLWLCKGYQFADNEANVQSYTAGQTVSMTADIRAPHTGIANVSIVATATNTVIGDALYSWDDYASNQSGVTADDEAWNITIPNDLGDQCTAAGDCVIQWYWYAESIDQTYEDCIDFTAGGSSDSSASTTAASASESATVASAEATTSATSIFVLVNSSASSEAAASTYAASSVEVSASNVVVSTISSSSTPVVSSISSAASASATSAASASGTVAISASVASDATSTVKTSVATSTSASVASTSTSTSSTTDANECMNTYNECIAASQPNPDWDGCSSTKDTCLETATYSRRAKRSGTLGRRMI